MWLVVLVASIGQLVLSHDVNMTTVDVEPVPEGSGSTAAAPGRSGNPFVDVASQRRALHAAKLAGIIDAANIWELASSIFSKACSLVWATLDGGAYGAGLMRLQRV